MTTNKKNSELVKEFYNKNPFPGPYTAASVKQYTGKNRYISFLSKMIKGSINVLDAGCGTGFISNFLAQTHPDCRFTGIDFSDSVGYANSVKEQLAITNVQFIKQDINDFKSAEQFDAVICQGVLHHIPGYQVALTHLKSMLEPNGMFLIGLYHPWGKALQKLMPKDYTSLALQIDQEEHPFELSFWERDVKKMFSGYSLVDSAPGVLLNWRNGGLTTYAFRKGEKQ